MKQGYVLANFGGPRCPAEIYPFLRALLTDRDVIRSSYPRLLHDLLFSWIAKKRSKTILADYQLMGGGSPIYADTERLADLLEARLGAPVISFHRYLISTHTEFISRVENLFSYDQIVIFPLFPQFSYATTGSIARLFSRFFSSDIVAKLRWVRSYFTHPAWINCMKTDIAKCLHAMLWNEEDTVLLFSPHGLPQRFVDEGDPYQQECVEGFRTLAAAFPGALSLLAYQSQFGKEAWIQPYTADICRKIDTIEHTRRQVVVVPLSFTSDHVETLVEVEHQYLPLLRDRGFTAVRCRALNLEEHWINAILDIMATSSYVETSMLVRQEVD